MTTIDSAYRSPEEDAAYFASIWGLSPAKMQVLEKAFRDHERNAPPRTAVEGVRRLIQPNIMLTASEVHVDGFERKAVFNALTYLTRTGELAHAGYGKYQAPPADFVPEPAPSPIPADEGVAGWQPIETAPKDGTQFLGFDPSKKYEPYDVWKWDATAPTDAEPGFWVNQADSNLDEFPTCWVPLPTPPALTP